MYRQLFDSIITQTDPETAHRQALGALRVAGTTGPGRRALRLAFAGRAPAHRIAPFARPFPGRLGLAAGLDKDASAVLGLWGLGFSFVEIGTVTRHPQPGNEPPRMWRHPAERALRNQMGFNNDGADVVAMRLRRLRSTPEGRVPIVGVNIGKSRITAAADATGDYVYSARALARYADYLVINVSSPNTPGLRDLQASAQLAPIIEGVRAAASRAAARDVPLLVKIAPDLADADIAEVCRLVKAEGIAGVVATNTTIDHAWGAGGVSGAPLRERSRRVVALARAELGAGPVIMGAGGVSTPADGVALLAAGADLVQAYSGFVYGGPAWPGRMNRALA